MTEHALIMCREPGRPSTLDKGHVTKAEEAEVEQFYDDLQDLLELIPKKMSFTS